MKTNRSAFFLVAPLGLLALAAAGCTAKEPPATAALPAIKDSATVPAAGGMPVADRVAATAGATVGAVPRWVDLEGHTYEMRVPFLAGVSRLEAVVAAQVAEVTAQRAAMTGSRSTADSKTWDAARKEMDDARSYLTAMGKESAGATADTWSQQKEKVGQAWVRTQAAYEKVKASTTG